MEPTNDSTTVSTETTEKTQESNSQPLTLEDVKNLLNETLTPINNDLSSLKRSTKKVIKSGDKGETSEKTQSDDSFLYEEVENLSLQVAGITEADEVKLYQDLKKETGLDPKKLLNSKYFKSELEDLRTARSNAEATTGIKGDKQGGGGKQSAEYWIAQGKYPTREEVSDPKVRQQIRNAMFNREKGTGARKFYNS